MQFKIYTLLFILLFFCVSANSYACKQKKNKENSKLKQVETPLTNSNVSYSISIEGLANEVTVNNKKQTATQNKELKQNNIQINGVGNKVTVNEDDAKGKVNVKQKGNNNTVKISQSSHQP